MWTPPVVVEADLSEADAQRLIAAGFDATRPFVDPDAPLSTHYLQKAQDGWQKEKGEFVFGDGCSGVLLSIVAGAVKTGEKFGCIE